MRLSYAFAVGALVGPLLAAPASAHAERRYQNPTVPPATEQQVANDARFRHDLGLRADLAYVQRLYDDARAGTIEASTTIGAIATPDEEALVQSRTHAVDAVVDVVDDYFKEHRDIYAGTWIDQAQGFVGIAVTGDTGATQQALSTRIGQTTVRWVLYTHKYTLDELYALQQQVDLATDDLMDQSVDIASTSIDEENDVVWVGVASDRTTATQILAQRFGNAPLHVEHEDLLLQG